MSTTNYLAGLVVGEGPCQELVSVCVGKINRAK